MSASASRPDEGTLRRFLTGTLTPDEMAVVADYLERHPEAVDTLNALAADDTLVSALRSGGKASGDPSDLRALLDRLRGMPVPRQDVTEEVDASAAASSDTTGDVTDEFEVAEAIRALLAPAQGPDEMGRLASYRVLRLLGKGGMGLVFEAEDVHLQRRVALKAMYPRAARAAAARQRFVREARAMAAIEHDHIVHVYQVGEDRGVPFLAMPLLQGSTLEALLAGGAPLSPAQAMRIGRQMAEGLAAAHDRGLIHRDVKPGNVWIEKAHGGRVKLLDFGLARLVGEEQGLTRSGTVVGTPAYMAPEQARGLSIDGRADLFGLGCVLYRMTTGRAPFAGGDTFAILTALATDTPPAPSTVNPAVPPALSALVMQLLEKDPARRPASAHDVAAALDRIPLTSPAAPLAVAAPAPAAVADPTTALPVAPAPVRRRPRAAVLVAAAVLLLAGGAALLAPLIVRLASPNGELVIEVDDPTIEVVVRQDGAVLHDRTKQREFHLRAGKGEVEFYDPDTGVKLTTKAFRIHRGGKDVVKADVHELTVPKPPPPPDRPTPAEKANADRRTAEWVLSVGGTVRVVVGRDRNPRITDVKDLPARGFVINEIDLSGNAKVTADGLALLMGLPALDFLNLQGTPLGDAEMAQLGRMRVGSLFLQKTGITDARLKRLQSIQTSTTLDLSQNPISDAGVETLRGIKGFGGLQNLHLYQTGLTAASLETLKTFQELRELHLAGTRVTAAGVKKLAAALPWCRIQWNGGVIEPHPTPLPAALSPEALVASPDKRPGAKSWTVETIGHRGYVQALAYHPDGRRLASFGLDSTVRVWDTAAGTLERALAGLDRSGPPTVPAVISWSPDGSKLAALTGTGRGAVWDAATGRRLLSLGVRELVCTIAWTADGKLLALGSRERKDGQWVRGEIWEVDSGRQVRPLPGPDQPGHGQTHAFDSQCAVWSPDRRWVYLSRGNGAAVLLSLDPVGRVQVWDQDAGFATFSPDSTRLVFGHKDGLQVWSLAEGRIERKMTDFLGGGASIPALSWSPIGDRVFCPNSLVDAATGKEVARLELTPSPWCSGWRPDGKVLALGLLNGSIVLASALSGTPLHTFGGHPGVAAVTSSAGVALGNPAALSPDRRSLVQTFGVSTSAASAVYRWDLRTRRPVQTATAPDFVQALAWRPDDGLCAVASARDVLLFGPAAPEVRKLAGHTQYVTHAAWSPDGKHLATGGTDFLALWSPETDGKPRQLGKGGSWHALAWSADGKRLLANPYLGPIRLWDVASGKLEQEVVKDAPALELVWSPDGKRIAAIFAPFTVVVLDTATGKVVRQADQPGVEVHWQADGRTLAFTGLDYRVRYWDTETGKVVREVPGPCPGTFTPDGKWLAARMTAAVRLWDLTNGRPEHTYVGLRNGGYLVLTPDGHHHGSKDVEKELVRIVQTDDGGQETLTADAFDRQFGWKNDPARVIADPPVKPEPPAPPAPPASPLDGLRRQDIAADELALAGGGDAAKAPAELVAVLGTGRMRHWAAVSSLAFSPDGKYLMSAGGDFTVRLWDVATGRPVDAVPSRDWRLYGLEPRPAGPPRLATVEFGRALHIPPRVQGLRTINSPFALSPDGKYVAGKHGPLNRVLLWDAAGKQTEVVRPDKYTLGNMAFSPDSALLAMTWYDEGANKEGVLEVWEVSGRKVRHTVPLGKGVRGFTVAFTPDGREVVAGCSDGTVHFRDVARGQERRTLQADLDVRSLSFSGDGKLLAAGSSGRHVYLWEVGSGKRLHTVSLFRGGFDSAVALSPDGTTLAAASDGGAIRLFHTATGRERSRPADDPGPFAGLAVGRDGRTLAAAVGDGPLTLYDLAGGRRTATLQPDGTPYLPLGRGQLLPLALSPDGRTVAAAAAGADRTLQLWDVPTANPRRQLPHTAAVLACTFSPDGKQLATVHANNRLSVWGEDGEKPLWTWVSDRGDLRSATYSPDGATLAVLGRDGVDGGRVQLIDAASGKPGRLFVARGGVAVQNAPAAFSPDGRLLAVPVGRSQDELSVLVWDVATGEERFRLQAAPAATAAVAFHPDGKLLASIGFDGTVRLWDLAAPAGTSRLVRTIPVGAASEKNMWQVAFAPDGRHLLTLNGNGTIYVMRLDPTPAPPAPVTQTTEPHTPDALVARPAKLPGATSWTLETVGHRGTVEAVAYSPGGEWLASGGDDGNVRVWNARTAALHRLLVRHPERVDGLAWSPDGKHLASVSGGDGKTACVWQVDAGKLVRTLPVAGSAVAWSPDGAQLAIGERESIRIYKTADWVEVRSVKAAPPVWRIGWSPDGKQLAAIVRYDSAVLRWDAAGQPLPPLKVDAAGLLALAWSPDGKLLAAGGSDKKVRIWDAGGKLVHTAAAGNQVNALAWLPDSTVVASLGSSIEFWQAADGKKASTIPLGGQTLAWAGGLLAVGNQEGTIALVDRSGKTEHTVRGHRVVPTRAVPSPDGKRLALTYWFSKIWDVDGRSLIPCGELVGHAYAWSPDGGTLAVVQEEAVALLDGKTGQARQVLERGNPWGGVAWSPDGTHLAVCGRDNSLRIHDVKGRRLVRTVAGIPNHIGQQHVVAWAPDGGTVAYSASAHVLHLIDVATGRRWTTEGADTHPVTAAAWSPDGKVVAVGNAVGALRLFDRAGKLAEQVPAGATVDGLSWLPGGRSIACGLANRTMRVWDLQTGTLGQATPSLPWPSGSPGRRLVSDCRAALAGWDVATGRRHGTLLLLDNDRVVTIGPDGHWHSDGLAVEPNLVHVVATEKGQELFSPAEFVRRFGFTNNPDRARLFPR